MLHPLWTVLVGVVVLALWGSSSGLEATTPDVSPEDECQAALQVRARGAPPDLRNQTVEAGRVDRALQKKVPRWRDATCFGNLGSPHCQQEHLRANSSHGTCMCTDGCVGADGSCWAQRNKQIASGFTLTNVKWPSYKVYIQGVSAFGQIMATRVASAFNLGQDRFELYELPGDFKGQKRFVLASHRWTDHVVMMDYTMGTGLSLWGAYAVDLAEYHETFEVENIMLHVCSARSKGQPDAIMIGSSWSVAGSAAWMYLRDGAFGVYGYWYPERLLAATAAFALNGGVANATLASIPERDAYWVPDPPFATGVLPDCP